MQVAISTKQHKVKFRLNHELSQLVITGTANRVKEAKDDVIKNMLCEPIRDQKGVNELTIKQRKLLGC